MTTTNALLAIIALHVVFIMHSLWGIEARIGVLIDTRAATQQQEGK